MRFSVPTVVAAGLVVAVAAALVFGGATSAAAFGSFNPGWDGTSDLRSIADSEGAEPIVLRNTSTYDAHGSGDVAFVLAPESGYSDAEARRVRRFVERGGTLVVADRDGPNGHALLAAVGAEARPAGPVLRDDRHHYRSAALPVADNVSDHALVANLSSLTLNHGTAVEPNGATVLVASSEFSYLDRDGSGAPDGDEVVRSHAVATVEPVGEGRVVVVGDPSVFINAMQGRAGNAAFTRALVAGADHAVVDASRTSLPPLVAALLTVRDSVLLQGVLGLCGLLAVAVTGQLLGRRRAGADDAFLVDDESLLAGLQRRYPALDPSRIRKVTEGVIRNRTEPGDNE